jgi:hypothetical protein
MIFVIYSRKTFFRQVPDKCTQMQQFPIWRNIIRLNGFALNLPKDFEAVHHEQAFGVMREILIRQAFFSFTYWNNKRSIMQESYLNLVYDMLQRDSLVQPESILERRQNTLELFRMSRRRGDYS